MKNSLKEFKIFTTTEFGIGLFTKKAKSFEDAFKRLSHNQKLRTQSIMDDDGEEIFKDDLLNLICFETSFA